MVASRTDIEWQGSEPADTVFQAQPSADSLKSRLHRSGYGLSLPRPRGPKADVQR
jgi:hypothetical protein